MTARRVALLSCALAACAKQAERSGPTRAPVTRAVANHLVASSDGTHLAFLVDPGPPNQPGVPEGIVAGKLALAEARPGAGHVVVGQGVSSVAGGFGFIPGTKWLVFLADYDHTRGAGTLYVAVGPQVRKQAEGVTFWSGTKRGPRGAPVVGYVADGKIGFVAEDLDLPEPSFGEDVGSLAFSPDGSEVLYRVRAARGGALYRLGPIGKAMKETELARHVTDFGWARAGCPVWIARTPVGDPELWAGAGCPRAGKLAGNAQSFSVSPDGARLAFLTVPDDPKSPFGQLAVVDLAARGEPRLMGKRVSEYRFARAGGALAWVSDYDPQSRNGKLGVALPGQEPRILPQVAQAFGIDPSGRWLAFLHRNPKKMYALELHLLSLASADHSARAIDEGVYGYQFSPDGERLAYKARCQDQARSCRVFVVPSAGGAPVELARKVSGFEFLPGGARLLLFPQGKLLGMTTDLAVVDVGGGAPTLLDALVNPSVQVLEGGRGVAYIVEEPGRQGVYLAPL